MLEKLEKMRIQKRLTVSSLITVLIASVAAIIAAILLFVVASQYNKVLTNYAFPQGDIGQAMADLADVRSATRGAIGYSDQSQIDQMVEIHDQAVEDLQAALPEIKKSIVAKAGEKDYNNIVATLDNYLEVDAKILKMGATTDAEQSKKAQDADFDELAPAYATASEAFQGLMDDNISLGDKTHSSLQKMELIMLLLIIVIIVAACILATKIGGKIAKDIAQPMDDLARRLETFAQGDLTSPFPEYHNDDELGEMVQSVTDTTTKLSVIFADMENLLGQMSNGNFNIQTSCEEEYTGDFRPLLDSIREMKIQIDGTLKEVREASEMVSAGALNLAEASQALAEGATDQAASAQQMQATIDEITNGLNNTVDQTNDAYAEAERVAGEAESSRNEMSVMVEAMNRISETSEKIGSVITEIEDIASQTNLLSLNASIEAARAGEAGKGFAVVADQIRTLAEQSAKSAVNTRELIEESIREIEVGNKAAERTEKVLVEVVEAIHQLADNSKGISETSVQQAESMGQADAGVTRIADIIQSNSATAEETSATSEELSAQATSMDEIVARFSLTEE